MNNITTEIKGKNLVITIPMQEPTASASGKTLLVASTHGSVKTTVMINGKPVTVSLNAYISNK